VELVSFLGLLREAVELAYVQARHSRLQHSRRIVNADLLSCASSTTLLNLSVTAARLRRAGKLLLGLFLETRGFEDHFVNFCHLEFSDMKS